MGLLDTDTLLKGRSQKAPALSLESGVHKAWKGANAAEARADISVLRPCLRLQDGVYTHSCFRKSPIGPTLSEIKTDPRYLDTLATPLADLIRDVLHVADPEQWGVTCAPARRHPENNFGYALCRRVAEILGLRAFTDFAVATGRARVHAVFQADKIPDVPNLIVIDDIMTTGSTMLSMSNLCAEHGKSAMFFTAIMNRS